MNKENFEEYKNKGINKFATTIYQICVSIILITICHSLAYEHITKMLEFNEIIAHIMQFCVTFSCVMISFPISRKLTRIDYED